MLLSDRDLEQALDEGDLVLEPDPPDKAIQPASIDLALGREAYKAGDDSKTQIGNGEILRLPAGGMAIVLTKEKIEVNNNVAGTIGLRSKFTRQGVDILAGPQIDPGFEGPLHLTLINLSPSSVSLSEGDRFCTVEFHRLSNRVKEGYEGQFQEADHITTDEIRDIEADEYTLSELHESMSSISRDVAKIEDSIDNMEENYEQMSSKVNTQMTIFTATVVTLAMTIVGTLIIAVLRLLGVL